MQKVRYWVSHPARSIAMCSPNGCVITWRHFRRQRIQTVNRLHRSLQHEQGFTLALAHAAGWSMPSLLLHDLQRLAQWPPDRNRVYPFTSSTCDAPHPSGCQAKKVAVWHPDEQRGCKGITTEKVIP